MAEEFFEGLKTFFNNSDKRTDNEKAFGENNETSKNKSTNDTWIPLFLSMLAMTGNQTPNIQLEKEVAYLSGKVDTLEKIILEKK